MASLQEGQRLGPVSTGTPVQGVKKPPTCEEIYNAEIADIDNEEFALATDLPDQRKAAAKKRDTCINARNGSSISTGSKPKFPYAAPIISGLIFIGLVVYIVRNK